MRKLILVVILLVAVLILSWWAKGANFSPFAMMQNLTNPKVATQSATQNQNTTTPTPIPVEIIITVTPNGFVPDVIMISLNTRITWINKTPFTANVTFDQSYAQLNLGDFGQNGSVTQVFSKAGRYSYYNAKNPGQKGTLVVK